MTIYENEAAAMQASRDEALSRGCSGGTVYWYDVRQLKAGGWVLLDCSHAEDTEWMDQDE